MRLSCPNVAQVEFTLRASRPWHVSHKFNKCGASPCTQVVGAFVLTLREGGGSVDVVRREIDAVLAFLSVTVDLAVKRSRATPGAGQRESGMPLGLGKSRPFATRMSQGAVVFAEGNPGAILHILRNVPDEFTALRSQYVISNVRTGRGGRRYPPYAFTEQGVAMLSSVLHSPRAIRVNVEIMRAFVRLRGVLAAHEDLGRRLAELERKYDGHDARFKIVFDVIRALMAPARAPSSGPPEKARRSIGFRVEEGRPAYRRRSTARKA